MLGVSEATIRRRLKELK
ncbi:hypothetical protein [Lysinibacillus fusiformis]|nr:hypothetical protein QYY55_12800 [Lysinibacillus fusiformis]